MNAINLRQRRPGMSLGRLFRAIMLLAFSFAGVWAAAGLMLMAGPLFSGLASAQEVPLAPKN